MSLSNVLLPLFQNIRRWGSLVYTPPLTYISVRREYIPTAHVEDVVCSRKGGFVHLVIYFAIKAPYGIAPKVAGLDEASRNNDLCYV